jgi:hypothetical protein
VLNTYDTLTDSLPDWPFTRFFFPMAYASGFRLETYAQLIWDGFIAVYELDGRFSDYWLPMKQITLVIETMFQEYFSLDAVDFVITEELVETLVGEAQFSLYLEFLHHEVAGEANVKR